LTKTILFDRIFFSKKQPKKLQPATAKKSRNVTKKTAQLSGKTAQLATLLANESTT